MLAKGLRRPWTYILLVIVVVAFFVAIWPAVWASQWNYFGSDDIWFGRFTHNEWVKNHNFFTTLGAAIYTSSHTWSAWQGNWTAVVMFSLNPSVFDNWGFQNFLGPIIVSGTLCLGTIVLSRTIAKYCFNAKWEMGLILGFSLSFVFTQLVPSFRSAFYWWSAAVNYGFYMGLFFLMLSSIIMYYKAKVIWKKIIHGVWIFLLSLFISGGMYVFITLIFVLGVFAFIYKMFIYKNDKDYWLYILYIPFLIGSTFNIFAPGNANRLRSEEGSGMRDALNPLSDKNPITNAYLYTFRQFFNFFFVGGGQEGKEVGGISIPYLASLVIIGIVVWCIVKNTKFKFRLPFLIPIMGFTAIAAYYTPNVYASGWDIKPRVFDGGYYLNWFVLILTEIFIVGWLKPQLVAFYKKNRKTVTQTCLGNAGGILQLIIIPVLIASFSLGYFNMVNYVNGFKGIEPGGLGASKAVLEEDTISAARGKTMPELNVEYKNYFIASLLGEKDPNNQFVQSCINDFYATGCQERLANTKNVELPDTREGDKLLTAHVDMCPSKGIGYNSYAEIYWNKLDKPEDMFNPNRTHYVNAFYPDMNTTPTGSGANYKYGTDETYQAEKQQSCQGYGFLDS